MKLAKVVFVLFVSISLSYGLGVKEGWNFIGASKTTSVDDLKKDYKYISQIFILQDNIWENITHTSSIIKATDGLLVYSNKDFNLYFKSDETSTKNIDLNKGWNFKALSMKTSVFTKIFNDEGIKIWTYKTGSSEWSNYVSANKEKNAVLESMQGFLIYSPNKKSYDIEELSVNLSNFKNKSSMNDFLEKIIILHKKFRDNRPRPILLGSNKAAGVPESAPESGTANKASGDVKDATSTNTQEKDVDEADIIKHDGENIFYIQNGKIYISSFNNAIEEKKSKELEVFKDYENVRVQNIYLTDNKLIIFGRKNHYAIYPVNAVRSIAPYPTNYNNLFYIQIYDVSDTKNISLKKDITVEGSLTDTRLSDNKLYVVSNFSPYFKVEYEKVYVECVNKYQPKDDGKCYLENFDKYDILEKHISPSINIDGTKSDLLSPDNFFASMKVDRFLRITTTLSFELGDDSSFNSISVMGPANTIYMSSKSLYLTSSYYDIAHRYNPNNIKTLIYKIALSDKLSYVDHIFVDGKIINQFSLSEYEDVLRIATTKGSSFRDDTDNMVITLKEDNGELKQIGYLGSLGKAGEIIRSVRFMGDKAFLVTFKRTDPFYTIDLSDAKNPKKAGELSIPGFSTYLHNAGNGQILALGNDADEEGRVTSMQVQLFDVSDFSKPKLLDKYLFDASHYSNSLYQHKAFTYRNSDKKFAMRVNSYKSKFYGFYVFDIKNNKINELDTIKNENHSYDGRSIIFTKNNKDYILMLDDGLSAKEIN